MADKEQVQTTVAGLNGPETELLEELTGLTFGEVAACLTGEQPMPIRVAAASSFVMRRREEPDADWDSHWNLPIDESLQWLSGEDPNPEG